jgi:Na+(H+)/acetate symporter ActP
MNRRQRAAVAAAAIAPVTIAGVFLIHCNCSAAAYGVLGSTAVVFAAWVLGAKAAS